MTPHSYRAPRKANKYNAKKTCGYDSKREKRRADELKLMQRAGEISHLEEQVRFQLLPKQAGERAIHYVADFRYHERGRVIVEDVKSAATRKLPVYIMKRKMMLYFHGIKLREVL